MTPALPLAEPVELRDRLRSLAAVAPELARHRLGEEMADLLARGLPVPPSEHLRKQLTAACHGYRRELWLWLAGERRWEHCAEGLDGRVRRRLGAAA